MIVAFTGLQQSGKTTLFTAVSGKPARSGSAAAPEEAVVKVPDPRFEWLVGYYRPRKVTNATIECLDLPGLDPSTSAGAAMSRRILGAARKADMLALVVRAFDPRGAAGECDHSAVIGDLDSLRAELLLADLEMVETRIERLDKEIRTNVKSRQQKEAELGVQIRLREALEKETPLSEVLLSKTEAGMISSLGLLTMKPAIVVFNTAEDLSPGSAADLCEKSPLAAIAVSAEIERELSLLDEAGRREFMDAMGMKESAAEVFIRSCYEAMGLISFLTVGEDEVRAWQVRKGTPALEAAGRIHSDIKRGFIRAETMSYEELRSHGDEKSLRAAGKVRLEGREYEVKDGDIISYRFNV